MYSRDMFERHRPVFHVKTLHGYGISTHCKTAESYIGDPIQYTCDFSFGTGVKKFCIIAKYDMKDPSSIYIDRVENNVACLLSKIDVEDQTAKLVRIALHEMYKQKPSITRFTFKDDSNIYCNGGDSGPRISMSYETLLKYNLTWYQQKFGAILPGFVSIGPNKNSKDIEQITLPISGVSTTFNVRPDSSMFYFLKSLSNMDYPSTPYESMVQSIPKIAPFRSQYELAGTPREFMANVRASFVTVNSNNKKRFLKKEYCLAVAPWFFSYMTQLRITLYYDQWYIPVSAVVKPDGFREEALTNANAARILYGGRHTTRKNNGGQWGVIPFYIAGRRFGGAEDL